VKPNATLLGEREKISFAFLFLGDEATTFGVSSTKFQLPNNFPHTPLFSRYLLPEKGRKNHPPILYIGACPVKTKKGTPCSLTLTGVPKKEKDTIFLLGWSAKFGGYDIEYPLFWQKNHSKITENFCGNPHSNAERVPQGKITGKNSGKKKREVQGFLLPQIFGSLTGVAGSDLETLAGAAAPANGEWELLGTNRIIKNTVGTFLLFYLPNYNKAKILFPAVLDGVAAFLEAFK